MRNIGTMIASTAENSNSLNWIKMNNFHLIGKLPFENLSLQNWKII